MPRLYDLRAVLIASCVAAASASAQTRIDAGKLQGLKWRNVGPATMSGRIADFAVARTPGQPDALYVAASIGGVWKTTDWGATWDPVFDSANGASSIGDVTVAPSNPNLVWVGTGEADNRQSSSWGDGVYKSLDGGRTWKFMGLKETRHVGRIVIHPTNSDIVYVAGGGHLWGSNPERGVFRTIDGGATWEKVLYVDENTGATDIVMDPQDPQTLFAAMYQRQRKSWGMNGGGPGSGIYRTNNGGKTWTKLTNGLPSGDLGRIGLDIYRRDGHLLYAVVEADAQSGGLGTGPIVAQAGAKGGIFKSIDRGDTWEQVNPINVRPMYFSQIRIDPNDPQRIYYGGTSIMTSHDGGKTFYDPGYGGQGVHPDQHALWIDPDNSNNLVLGNDGGVFLSYNKGKTWRFIENLPLGQFYEVDVDMRDPYFVCGGLQDNGSWCTPSATKDMKGISRRDAYLVGGGDGYYVRIDKGDPLTYYVEQGGASIKRFNFMTGETQEVQPQPAEKPTPNERGEDVGRLRGNWNSPILTSSFDPKTIYVGMNRLFRSRDRGATWEAISPDLTLNINRDTLQLMGARVPRNALSRHDGISAFSTLTHASESSLDQKVLYSGSDDGQVQVTRDGGATWKNVTAGFPGLPKLSYVSRVVASRHVASRVYATFDNHRSDDYKAYVYVSNDYGQTWKAIDRGLPETSVYAILEHPRIPNLLFLGHERGVHVSIDGGENWVSLNSNLPTVPVAALAVQTRENDLVAATFGRAFWILDDLGPLEALASLGSTVAQSGGIAQAGDPSGDRALPSRPGRAFNTHHYNGWFWAGYYAAPNPEYGAGVSYWLSQPGKTARIRVLDGDGTLVKTIEGPAHAGINRVYWDLRAEPTTKPDPNEPYNPVFRPPPVGPPVLPGNYTAMISVDGRGEMSSRLTVQADPAVTITEAERAERQKAIESLYKMQKIGVAAQEAVKPLTEQLGSLKKQLGTDAPAELRNRLTSVADSLSAAERAVTRDAGSAGRLLEAITGFTGAPTRDQAKQVAWARENLTASITRLNGLLQKSIPDLYTALRAANVWPTPVRAIPVLSPGTD